MDDVEKDVSVTNFKFGDRFLRDYNDISYLGKGGCAVVFSCKSVKDHKKYAVKISNVGGDNADREGEILKEFLGHRSIVQYQEHWLEPSPLLFEDAYYPSGSDEKEKSLYLVMELCQRSLYDWFEKEEDIDCGTSLRWFREIINGLDYIHKKEIIHGDIKSENVFIDDQGHMKIGDFGFGRGTSSPKSRIDDINRATCIFVEMLHPRTKTERDEASGDFTKLREGEFPEGFMYETVFLRQLLLREPPPPKASEILQKLDEATNLGGTDDDILSRLLKMSFDEDEVHE